MGFVRTSLAAVAVAIAFVAAPAAFAETLTYKVALSPANEVPPLQTGATGSADLTYDTVTRTLTWNITHSGLSGAPTAAHFHGPATPLINAPVIVVFEGSLASPIKGMTTLKPDQAMQFLNGSWYINIHTPGIPGRRAARSGSQATLRRGHRRNSPSS